jgi:MFS family permease
MKQMSRLSTQEKRPVSRSAALRFVVLIGILSLFADMTYEGARSINGPFLAVLGATGTAVGVISGLGELLGYLVRLLSGYASSRTGRYWFITGIGYVVNLLAVPLLALAGNWEVAATLMIFERVGKGIRNPPRDAMLSHAGTVIGPGWAFALREALDQTGAMIGPLAMAVILYLNGSYRTGYAFLLIPALVSLAVLATGRRLYPNPRELETGGETLPQGRRLPRAFWIYLTSMSLIALGYADFTLVSFHLQKTSLASAGEIPILYAVAMAVSGASALVFGRWFDRGGLPVLAFAAALSAFFAPFVFLGGFALAVVGMVLWGIGMGIQDSLMSAPIVGMVSAERRAYAYGIFNACYGVAWFAGSALLGVLYDHVSILAVVVFSVVVQLSSIPVLLLVAREQPNRNSLR